MRWMFSQHPRMAKRWAEHTKSIRKLPEKVAASRRKLTIPFDIAALLSSVSSHLRSGAANVGRSVK